MGFLKNRGWGAVRSGTTVLLLAAYAPMLAGETGSEYEVKAAFLYKFASFVEWQNDDRTAAIGICVMGQDPFGPALDKVIKGKSINGKEFLIRRLKSADAVSECHIVFIGVSENKQLAPILARLRGLPVLTVGDAAGFCESGGAINLVVSDKRVQLEINPASAERAHLLLSSRLLSLARIVREDSRGSH